MKTTLLLCHILLLATTARSVAADATAPKPKADAEARGNAKLPMPKRVAAFTAKYDTEEKVTKRLEEWTKEEPNSPEPYVMAANAYLKNSSQVHLNAGDKAPGFASMVDPKTKKVVGTINEGPSARGYELALATLTTATQKFPQRLDIHVGRLAIAKDSGDVPVLLAAGQDLVKAAQTEGDKMRWVDDAPLPAPLKQKVPDELQGRIVWLYQQEKPETDEAAYKLSLEGLKIAPENFVLLNDAAIYHLYKQQWGEARPFLEHAEKANPKDLYVKHNLSKVLMELGEKKAARAKLQEIVKLAPESEEAKEAKKELRRIDG